MTPTRLDRAQLEHLARAVVAAAHPRHPVDPDRLARWVASGDQTTVQAEARAYAKALTRRAAGDEWAITFDANAPADVRRMAGAIAALPPELGEEDSTRFYEFPAGCVTVVARRDGGPTGWAEAFEENCPGQRHEPPFPLYGHPRPFRRPSWAAAPERHHFPSRPAGRREVVNPPALETDMMTTATKTRKPRTEAQKAARRKPNGRGPRAPRPAKIRAKKAVVKKTTVKKAAAKKAAPVVAPARRAARYVSIAPIPDKYGVTQARAILEVVEKAGDEGITAAGIREKLGPRFSPDPASTVAFHLTQSKHRGLVAARVD